MQKNDQTLQNHSTSNQNLESLIGQISSILTERTARTLISNNITNPKEHVKAIKLKSGKEIGEPQSGMAESSKEASREEVAEPHMKTSKQGEAKQPKDKSKQRRASKTKKF